MKNESLGIIALAIVLFVTLGCGSLGSDQKAGANSNKTLTDTAIDTAVGDQKIGVAECDEVIDMLTGFANNPDDNFIVKAGKQLIANKIRESLKQSIEENQANKAELAKDCKQFKTELEKAMMEQGQGGGK